MKKFLIMLVLFSGVIFGQTKLFLQNNKYFVADSTWDDLVIPAQSINPAGSLKVENEDLAEWKDSDEQLIDVILKKLGLEKNETIDNTDATVANGL